MRADGREDDGNSDEHADSDDNHDEPKPTRESPVHGPDVPQFVEGRISVIVDGELF